LGLICYVIIVTVSMKFAIKVCCLNFLGELGTFKQQIHIFLIFLI